MSYKNVHRLLHSKSSNFWRKCPCTLKFGRPAFKELLKKSSKKPWTHGRIGANWPSFFAYTLFNHQNTLKKGINAFSLSYHTYPDFNKNPPLQKKKVSMQGNNLHIFPWHLQDQKHFPKNQPVMQFGMPKKMMPKSQAKF